MSCYGITLQGKIVLLSCFMLVQVSLGFGSAIASESANEVDCSNLPNKVEQLICSDSDLKQFSEEIFGFSFPAFREAQAIDKVAEFRSVENAQLEIRNSCEDKLCLVNWYKGRILYYAGAKKADGSSIKTSDYGAYMMWKGHMHLKEKRITNARSYFELASLDGFRYRQSSHDAFLALTELEDNEGNYDAAREYAIKGSDMGCHMCSYWAGSLFDSMEGGKNDIVTAMKYYKLAHTIPEAMARLEHLQNVQQQQELRRQHSNDEMAQYAYAMANQLMQASHPACHAVASHVINAGTSGESAGIREMRIESLVNRAPGRCF